MLLKAHLTLHSRMTGSWVTNHTIIVIQFIWVFSVQLLLVFFPSPLDLFNVYQISIVYVLYCIYLWEKHSLDISSVPKEIACLSPSVVFF